MQLPKATRDRLRRESRIVADMVAATPMLGKKLYLFSALFGEVNRAMNQHWNSDLALIHLVLVSAHQNILGRISQPAPLNEDLPKELPDALTKITKDFADLFEGAGQDQVRLHEVLGRIAEIAYAATGNGYYLYLKGEITL